MLDRAADREGCAVFEPLETPTSSATFGRVWHMQPDELLFGAQTAAHRIEALGMM